MKATELRIGNLISYRNEITVSVSNLGHHFETVNLYNGLAYGSDDVSDYELIPLTDKWLEKFGFEIEEYSETGNKIATKKFKEYYSPFALLQLKGWKYYTFTTIVENGVNEYCKDIKYVHQLQNLYFDLTGEELTINHSKPRITKTPGQSTGCKTKPN